VLDFVNALTEQQWIYFCPQRLDKSLIKHVDGDANSDQTKNSNEHMNANPIETRPAAEIRLQHNSSTKLDDAWNSTLLWHKFNTTVAKMSIHKSFKGIKATDESEIRTRQHN
jgi:hypothetical protein